MKYKNMPSYFMIFAMIAIVSLFSPLLALGSDVTTYKAKGVYAGASLYLDPYGYIYFNFYQIDTIPSEPPNGHIYFSYYDFSSYPFNYGYCYGETSSFFANANSFTLNTTTDDSDLTCINCTWDGSTYNCGPFQSGTIVAVNMTKTNNPTYLNSDSGIQESFDKYYCGIGSNTYIKQKRSGNQDYTDGNPVTINFAGMESSGFGGFGKVSGVHQFITLPCD